MTDKAWLENPVRERARLMAQTPGGCLDSRQRHKAALRMLDHWEDAAHGEEWGGLGRGVPLEAAMEWHGAKRKAEYADRVYDEVMGRESYHAPDPEALHAAEERYKRFSIETTIAYQDMRAARSGVSIAGSSMVDAAKLRRKVDALKGEAQKASRFVQASPDEVDHLLSVVVAYEKVLEILDQETGR